MCSGNSNYALYYLSFLKNIFGLINKQFSKTLTNIYSIKRYINNWNISYWSKVLDNYSIPFITINVPLNDRELNKLDLLKKLI
jgi:hypothetical protein